MADSPEKRKAPLRAFAVAGFFALTPPFAAGGAMGLAALSVPAGLAATPWTRLLPRSGLHWAFLAALAALLAWVCASAAWSPYENFRQAWKLTGGVACGLLLVAGAGADPDTRRLARAAGVGCAIALAALLLIEAFAGLPLNRLGQPDTEAGLLARNPARGVTVQVMLLWGVMGALAGGSSLERTAWRFLFMATGLLTLQFGMVANVAAFIAGLGAYLAAQLAPRLAIMTASIVTALWLLAAPFAVPLLFANQTLVARLPESWMHRVEIWRFTCERIGEKFWFGWGLDASRTFDDATKVINGVTYNLMPLHPHSASLQVWLETGAVGAALFALAAVIGGAALAAALKNQRAAAAAACGVMGSCFVINNISFGAWQEWWVATIFAAAALAAAAVRVKLGPNK